MTHVERVVDTSVARHLTRGAVGDTSVARHLARGAVGFAALIGSVALIPVVGWISLILAPVGLLALRGCPTCWLIGLTAKMSAGRLQRNCESGRCELTAAPGRGGR